MDRAARGDARGLWWFLGVVGVSAIIGGTTYLIAVRTDVADRYTGTQAREDKAEHEKIRAKNLSILAEQRAADLKAQAEINSTWRESNAEIKAMLNALDRRAVRIETKLDASK